MHRGATKKSLFGALLLGGLVCLTPAAAKPDVVHLKDGTTVEGEVRRVDKGWTVTSSNGKETFVDEKTVQSIDAKRSSISDSGDTAKGRLESLRRSVANLDDIKLIVSRYKSFIEANDKNEAGEEAKKDLQVWLDRQNQGLVKVGGNWVTPEQRDEIKQKAILAADQARALIKDNRYQEAEAVLKDALAVDPENSAAVYLRGIVLFRQDQIIPARKAFEAVNALVKEHGPTLNNLAVIYWRQNQQGMALNAYDKAMLAMPNDQQVLDNVAEALNALPESMKNNATAQRVQKRFNEQDAQLQREMMTKGLYRWGGTYIDQKQMDQIQALEKEHKDLLSKLAGDFDTANSKLSVLDDQISRDQRTLTEIQASSVGYDQLGNLISIPYPPAYWDTQREIDRLNVQRKELVAKMDQVRAAAKAETQKSPIAKFTGIQHIIGADAAPVNLGGTSKTTASLSAGAPAPTTAP